MTIRNHYETLLAAHYTWMFGRPFDDKVAEQRRLFEHLGALPKDRGLAFDLGSGPGFQAIALAELGFTQVIAVDLSPTLLTELEHHKQGHAIETREADLVATLAHAAPESTDMIVCMGDTLTPLESRAEVTRLFAHATSVLAAGGTFVLTYRDLSAEVTGTDRFIPVASDANRHLTCFLEYAPDTVMVHDLLHEREGEQWSFRASAYRKLRLPVDWVATELRAAGFTRVEVKPAGRLSCVLARKT
ncbi:MAG: methyltransferase domain-containing protein [Rhodospirillaceae bacterium]|nr:methyltransferase domain-containing protein [Rhodospirillaceae bacterium]